MRQGEEPQLAPRIPKDATIATVWPHLTDPRGYVAGARQKLMTCAEQHGNAYVRIGVTGSGQKPCYRVFYKSADGSETVYGSYWDNHDPLEISDAVTPNWSSASMDFGQVDAFLKEKVNWKKG
jgi:hypothetical protein